MKESSEDTSPSKVELDANSALAMEEYRSGVVSIKSKPKMVTVETTGVCNLACVMCSHGLDEPREYIHLPEELAAKLRPVIGGAQIVQLHGLGEPLMNKAFWTMLAMTHDQQYVAINTNGILVNKANADRLIASSLSEICFSLDAATPETYRKIRGADFATVLNAIRYVVEEKRKIGKEKPFVHMNMTLMRENIEEAPAFVRLAHELGAQKVMMWHMNSIPMERKWQVARDGWVFDYHQQHLSKHADLSNRMIRRSIAEAKRLGIELELDWAKQVFFDEENDASEQQSAPLAPSTLEAAPDNSTPSPKDCNAPWTWMLVQTNGEVQPCCFGPCNHLGSLWTSDVEAIWNGPAFRRLRENILADRVDHACAGGTCKFVAGRPASHDVEHPTRAAAGRVARRAVTFSKSVVRGAVGEGAWARIRSLYRGLRLRLGQILL
ncbi:MAG: radical SAM protein [Nitrospinota bacterium]|nr:radical SAM protein [Nitrospinota bacterium]